MTAPGEAGQRTAILPVLLVLAAMPFVRPNIFGEVRLSVVGFLLLAVAAAAVLLARDGGAPAPPSGQPGASVVICLCLAYLWLMVQAAATNPGPNAGSTIQGLFLTAGSVLALVLVCQQPQIRLAVGRAFVIVLLAMCASLLVTALIWLVAGVGSGEIGAVRIGTVTAAQPVYFPLTLTQGVQTVFGVELPRFTGLGREPGWMAMYCGVGYFLADMVGMRRWWVRPLLLIGLIGCISTAGFGVFVVALAYHAFLRDNGDGIRLGGYLRQLFGLCAVAAAVWVATAAPVLGLSAKQTQNETSLDERQQATVAGLRALTEHPLGGHQTETQGGINLISDIAVSGLPFVLLICAALLLPMSVRGALGRYSSAPIVIVFLTLLLAQPPKDSTWAYAVVVLAAMLRKPDLEPWVTAFAPDPPPTDTRRAVSPTPTADHHRRP